MSSQASGQFDRVAWDSDRTIVDVATVFDPVSREFRILRTLLDSSGAVSPLDTLRLPPADSLNSVTFTRPVSGGGTGSTVIAQPFGPRALRAFGPAGEYATAVSSRYAVSWHDLHGKRIRLIEREVDAPPLSRSETSRSERTLESVARRFGVAKGGMPFKVPSGKAPLQNLAFDLNGRLWVELSVEAGHFGRAEVYQVDGSRPQVFTWPTDVSMNLATVDDTVGLGLRTDSLGVQSVVVMHFTSNRK